MKAVGPSVLQLLAVVLVVWPAVIKPTVGVGYVVSTVYGRVVGTPMTVDNYEIIEFKNIPYAKPPVGRLRFQPPQIPDTWQNDQTQFIHGREKCLQVTIDDRIEGNEDCLYLDIYVPKNRFDANTGALAQGGQMLPTAVFIPGFDFQTGDKNEIRPGSALMNSENGGNILAVMNYRLGPFGFLGTEDESMPANQGLYDQRMALKFVRENIARFGGDNRITLIGFGAGAISISFHIFNSVSQGYFDRAIISGGSGVSPDAFTRYCYHNAYHFAYQFNCHYRSTYRLRDCLQETSASRIINGVREKRHDVRFLPCIDGNFTARNTESFIAKLPRQLYETQSVKIPVIYGYPVNAGNIHVFKTLEQMRHEGYSTSLRENLHPLLERLFKPYEWHDDARVALIAAMKYQYFKNYRDMDDVALMQALIQMMTDFVVGAPVDFALTQHLKTDSPNTFMYLFEPKRNLRIPTPIKKYQSQARNETLLRGSFVNDFYYSVNTISPETSGDTNDNNIVNHMKGIIGRFVTQQGSSQLEFQYTGLTRLTKEQFQYGNVTENGVQQSSVVANYGYFHYRQFVMDFWNYMVYELMHDMEILSWNSYSRYNEANSYKSATWSVVAGLILLGVIVGLLVYLVIKQRKRLQSDQPNVSFKAVSTREDPSGRM